MFKNNAVKPFFENTVFNRPDDDDNDDSFARLKEIFGSPEDGMNEPFVRSENLGSGIRGYETEIKYIFAGLPRCCFTDDPNEGFVVNTKTADGKVALTWCVETFAREDRLLRQLHVVQYLLENHLYRPKLIELGDNLTKTVYLGSASEIAEIIEIENPELIVSAFKLFAGIDFLLQFKSLKNWGLSAAGSYEAHTSSALDHNRIPTETYLYWKPTASYVQMLEQCVLTTAEFAAVKHLPAINQRWFELITFWRRKQTAQSLKSQAINNQAKDKQAEVTQIHQRGAKNLPESADTTNSVDSANSVNATKTLIVLYEDLCRWMPMTLRVKAAQIEEQLEKLHQPHLESGFLRKVQITRKETKSAAWQIKYQF